MGRLFVVATPIGELSDLSPRARAVLASVACIAAEDTRVTRRMLSKAEVRTEATLLSYHDHNETQRAPTLVRRLEAGEDVALVSDAGTPLVSDPGYRLVVAALKAGIEVVPVPGACAAVAAVSASGLPSIRFVVLGFLPRQIGARQTLLERYSREEASLVLYVAPHRLLDVLNAIQTTWGPDRRLAMARNLTKPTEAWVRGTVGEVLASLTGQDAVRGELTLVVEGATGAPLDEDARLDRLIEALVAQGLTAGQVREVVASVFDRPRRWVYQRALAALDQPDPGDESP